MPDVHFYHPHVSPNTLTVRTGANKISWGYKLNTQKYPTYGGEVVQILSASMEDFQIEGDVRSYAMMESIYGWFLKYIQIATAGRGGKSKTGVTNYNQEPVTFSYPEMGWTLQIVPKSLPGLRYGTQVVAPSWRMNAHIYESDRDLEEIIIAAERKKLQNGSIDIQKFGRVTGDIGYIEENPFSDPFPGSNLNEDPRAISDAVHRAYGDIADYYSNLVKSYHQGDFDEFLYDYGSAPAVASDASPGGEDKQGGKTKKKKDK